MLKPKIYADFHNADPQGRIRLDCVGTMEDLAQQQVELSEGLVLTLCADDLDDKGQLDELLVDGVVSFSQEEHCWIAVIDWAAIHHASQEPLPHAKNDNNASSQTHSESSRSQPGA